MGDKVQTILSDRSKTHGPWSLFADMSQHLKDVMRDSPAWEQMTSSEREAADMIMHKMSRILTGDPHFAEHWFDTAGYATRAGEALVAHNIAKTTLDKLTSQETVEAWRQEHAKD